MSDAADNSPSPPDPFDQPTSAGPADDTIPPAMRNDDDGSKRGAMPAETSEPGESWFGLRPGDRLIVALLVGTALSLMGVDWLRLSGWGMRPVEIERQHSRTYRYRIDINTAGKAILLQLEGIGPTLAKRIIADRARNGPFRSIDDLQRVRGIGPRKVETIRKWLTLGGDPSAERAVTP